MIDSLLADHFEPLSKGSSFRGQGQRFRISIRTKALSLVYVDPAHQALIGRILGLKEGSMNCSQIAAYRNDEGVVSWTGKRFYAELVFGIFREARRNADRIADAVVDVRCELVSI